MTFHMCSKVSRHICHLWSKEKPCEVIEWQRDFSKVNIWLGSTKAKINDPFFFNEASVTGIIYLDMLQQFLKPQFLDDGILDNVFYFKCFFQWTPIF